MGNRWFRLPDIREGTNGNEHRPDTKGYPINDFSGNKDHPGGAPIWIVRVYADTETLDSLASEPGVTELDNVPTTALNNMFRADRTDSEWNKRFKVS